MVNEAVRRFEGAFAEHLGVAAARAFWMGRVALYALLRALGVGPNDRVGICSYTCLGVVEAITRLRAAPVFLDVDRHMNVAPQALERLAVPLRALVVQPTFGVPSQLDACFRWADERGVPVIEDCCHALDTTWEGKPVGTFGVGAIFGFEWGKPFSAGQGGLVTFNDRALAREVDRLVQAEAMPPTRLEAQILGLQRGLYRWLVRPRTRRALRSVYRWAGRRGWITTSETRAADLIGPVDGFFKLFSPSQARVALRELHRWPENRARRDEAAHVIRERLSAEGIEVLAPDSRARPVYLRVPIWVRRKEQALAEAESALLDVAGWYSSPGHPLRGTAPRDLGYDPGACATTEEAFTRVVTLPTRPALKPAELDEAIRILQAAL